MFIKRIKEGKINNWYLCDDKNQINIIDYDGTLELLEGYELSSYDYLFNEEMLFQWKKRSTTIQLSERLKANPKAWVREIKIKELLSDDGEN